MDIKQAFEHLEGNKIFRNWRKSNKSDYFSYAFKILMENRDDDWQIGFYNKKKDKITTFILENSGVSIRKDEEVFKKDETKVMEVELNNVKLNFYETMEKANSFKKEKYPKEASIKIIAILQNTEKFGTVWNITFITESFNILNIKIAASNGKILEEKLEPIISFKKD